MDVFIKIIRTLSMPPSPCRIIISETMQQYVTLKIVVLGDVIASILAIGHKESEFNPRRGDC
jgi:hypothetical protein